LDDLQVHRPECRLSGEVDVAAAPATGAALLRVAQSAPGPNVELDCSELTFIDASGITMLLRVAAESGKAVRLLNVEPCCRRVFEVLDLCERFGIEDPTSGGEKGRFAISA